MKTWTPEEISILTSNYNSVSNAVLQKLLPSKSKQAIYKKAYKLGLRKSKEIEFLNRSLARRRKKGSNWNGGVRVTKRGYRQILFPEHPRADSSGYVMEHILVWEQETGFPVPDGCCIHFVDIVAWAHAAEFVSKYFTKGRMAVVEGRLQIRDWKDKEGNNRRSAEVVAESVYFADSRQEIAPQEQEQNFSRLADDVGNFAEIDQADGQLPF